MSDHKTPADESESPSLSDDQRLAKLIAASLDAEEDALGEGTLSLPDSMQDASAGDEDFDADADTDVVLDEIAPDEDTSESQSDAPVVSNIDDEEEAMGPSWSQNADARPLLADGEDEEQLRAQINQRIAAMSGEGEDDEPVPDAVDMEAVELRGAIEALLLVATKPISAERLAGCLPGVSEAYVGGVLAGLSERYRVEQRGWDLRRLAGGWQMLTRPSLHPWVRQLNKTELPSRLSRSAMETLAIVAYKQPVTRGDIEDIRGVQCGPMLRQLMDLKLVQVVGRHEDAVGRPMLYGTTPVFLDRFGLGDIGDLPRRHEFGD